MNANTGAPLWKVHVEEHPEASITGTPRLEGGRLYVPVSGGEEEVAAGNPTFVCCKFRGSLVALDAKTGKQISKSYTIPDEAKLMGKTANSTGFGDRRGSSVWSPPTVDAAKHAVYFGTGVNYAPPGTNASDAVVALDLNTGEKLWAQQLMPGDVFNFGCNTEQKLEFSAGCGEEPGYWCVSDVEVVGRREAVVGGGGEVGDGLRAGSGWARSIRLADADRQWRRTGRRDLGRLERR